MKEGYYIIFNELIVGLYILLLNSSLTTETLHRLIS